MKVRLLTAAVADIRQDVRYFESQSPGLGKYFRFCIKEDLQRLRVHAGIHAREHGHFRMISKRFPHVIYYEILDGVAVVAAIIDNRRDPEWIAERLS